MPLRTLLVAALAVAGLAVPPASAGQDSRFEGNCGFDSVAQETATGPDRFRGAIYLYGALYAPDPAANPVSASVTCYISVDGVPQPGARVTMPATGAVAAAAVVDFQARDDQIVVLCMEIDFLSDDTPTQYEAGCGGMSPEQIPPQWVINLVDDAFDLVDPVVLQYLDPVVCPPLAAHADTYGPVTVAPDGDVDVADSAFWDCPPYGAR